MQNRIRKSLMAFALTLGVCAAHAASGVSSEWRAAVAQVDGVLVTPANQEQLGVYIYLMATGCERSREVYAEIQYPSTLGGEPVRGARLRSTVGEASQELYLAQKRIGKELLIATLCMTADLLKTTSLALIYSGAGSQNNLIVSDFLLWAVEK
ncbi:MAG: hypothetical protein RBS88_09085 [Spongiibacteraceae bacterium]|jgi:hypothetical protein|nr:hypothetical protein [Spongiibacteraceae bacterium]